MNKLQAHQQAKAQSKQSGDRAVVVYVFDQGYDVYTQEQVDRYSALINAEAMYFSGIGPMKYAEPPNAEDIFDRIGD